MTIDKANTSILEHIKTLPKGEDIEQIRDSVQLNLHAATLAKQKPELEKVYTSEIKEERTFERGDIEKLIVLFAMANKLELDNLRLTEIIHDEEGALLALEVKIPNNDGGYQLINYTLKGRHRSGSKSYQNGTTNLDRTYWDKDDMPENGGIIAEYADGKWDFTS